MDLVPKQRLTIESINISRAKKNERKNVWIVSKDENLFVEPKSCVNLFFQSNQVDHGNNAPTIDDSEWFNKSIAPILRLTQIFGVFPTGISIKHPEIFSFNFISFRTFHSFIVLIFLTSLFLNCIVLLRQKHDNQDHTKPQMEYADGISVTIYFAATLCEFLIFFCLPPKWIKLQRQWRNMEMQMNRFISNSPKLRWKFNIISSVMMMCTIFQHIWWISIQILLQTGSNTSAKCQEDCFETDIIANKHDYASENLIHILAGIFQSMISIFPRCVSNFTDLFIILVRIYLSRQFQLLTVSTGLAERYKFLNNITINSKIWNNHEDYWYQLRVNYSLLSNLVKETDKLIAPLILISCAHNFIYICIELFIGISLKNDVPLVTIYSFYAFGFVVLKTIAVMFSASRVHDHSKVILSRIYRCPGSKYTIETERLHDLLSGDNVVLTGMKFFFITRNFMLTIAGTIVTYEIILLQLSKRNGMKQ